MLMEISTVYVCSLVVMSVMHGHSTMVSVRPIRKKLNNSHLKRLV